MIYIITGRPGGGKSYESVAYHILPAIKEGRKVKTNVALNLEWFVEVYGRDVLELIEVVDGQLNEFGKTDRPFSTIADYQDDWRDDKGRAPLLVIDEAHMVIPTRGCPTDLLEWYSMHRHYGFDLVLMTQNAKKIHRDIRDMCELQYYCVKNTAMGSKDSYTQKVRNGVGGEVMNTRVRKYKAQYFKFYNSHTGSSSAVDEATAKDVKPLWKHWTVWLASILLLVGPIMLVSNGGLFGDLGESPPPEQNVVEQNMPTTETEPKQSRRSRANDPLSDYVMYVSGHTKQIAYDDKKRPIRALTVNDIYIDVYEKDFKLFTFTQHDLVRMGYKFAVLADCVYSATFDDVSRLIVCGDYQEAVESKAARFSGLDI